MLPLVPTFLLQDASTLAEPLPPPAISSAQPLVIVLVVVLVVVPVLELIALDHHRPTAVTAVGGPNVRAGIQSW